MKKRSRKQLLEYIKKLEQYIEAHCESQVEFTIIEKDIPPSLE